MCEEIMKEKRGELNQRIENEYALFRFTTLSKSRREIYDDCNIIHFYECLYEYFLYKETIEEKHIRACLACENILINLYDLYLKNEVLHYSRWGEIEEILDELDMKSTHNN